MDMFSNKNCPFCHRKSQATLALKEVIYGNICF